MSIGASRQRLEFFVARQGGGRAIALSHKGYSAYWLTSHDGAWQIATFGWGFQQLVYYFIATLVNVARQSTSERRARKEQIGSHRAILIGHSMGCRVIMEAFQQSKIIPGAGHFAMIEAAPAVNHEIQTFATHLAS